jgi:DNA-directed RNA polymerase subunit RPC12/RpoP
MIGKRVIDSWESYFSAEIIDEIKESLRCPRCGAQMESVGGGVGCLTIPVDFVVPPILVLRCPQCGYEERPWA